MKKQEEQFEKELKRIKKKFLSLLLKPSKFIVKLLNKRSLRASSAMKKNFWEKVLDFVKYHNAFTIALILVFVFSATIFASEGARDTIIGEKKETIEGMDNSVIINKNLNSFDPRITVNSVNQDENNYYVKYNFNTVGIKENKWEELQKERILKVSKDALKKNDLGLYVQKELSQVIDNEMAYLNEVQKAEREKGQTEILTTTKYTGLVGLALNIKDKVFSNYSPVVKKPAKQIVSVDQENSSFETDNSKNNKEKDSKSAKKDSEENNSAVSAPATNIATTNLNGITLYDQNSKDPFCISMIEGSIMARSGECGSSSEESNIEVLTEDGSTSTISTSQAFPVSVNENIQQISSLLKELRTLQASLESSLDSSSPLENQ